MTFSGRCYSFIDGALNKQSRQTLETNCNQLATFFSTSYLNKAYIYQSITLGAKTKALTTIVKTYFLELYKVNKK